MIVLVYFLFFYVELLIFFPSSLLMSLLGVSFFSSYIVLPVYGINLDLTVGFK